MNNNTTTIWLICVNCREIGEYVGATRVDAIAAYVRDAGAASIAAAAEALDMSTTGYLRSLDVSEVP